MSKVEVKKAIAKIEELIKLALSGEEVILTENDQPIIKLVPMQPNLTQRPPLFGSDEGIISMSEDFDEPLEDFDEYTK